MMRIYHIDPLYKSFIWAGRKLIDRFGIDTDLPTVGTIYCVIALPGELDNIVRETGEPLSTFYEKHRELFACSDEVFPVRMTITCNEGFQSYQLHPDDAYAFVHEGCRGKVSGAVTLDDEGRTATWLFGHKVGSLEEFKECVEQQDWGRLFGTIEVRDGDYVHTPAGVIHGGKGAGAISATFGTNSDITYRFFDEGRNDPDRPLALDDVYACVHFPEVPFCVEPPQPLALPGMKLITYHDVDGEYVALRLQVEENASYEYDAFLFITCVRGSGSIDGVSLGLGETLLVPAGYGSFELAGSMDCIAISYHEKGA
ncbi:hypothetical protein [uncultured Enorma sp.]|uniref:hypothetical protein n=1 Tax=uncultured Enorma sp. TaxID=1714346 RepID=UPI002805F734|nr:hypothetical protein [uncultured Enorma sp.]